MWTRYQWFWPILRIKNYLKEQDHRHEELNHWRKEQDHWRKEQDHQAQGAGPPVQEAGPPAQGARPPSAQWTGPPVQGAGPLAPGVRPLVTTTILLLDGAEPDDVGSELKRESAYETIKRIIQLMQPYDS